MDVEKTGVGERDGHEIWVWREPDVNELLGRNVVERTECSQLVCGERELHFCEAFQ